MTSLTERPVICLSKRLLTKVDAGPDPLSSRVRGVRVEQIRGQVEREKYIAAKSLQEIAVLPSFINPSYVDFEPRYLSLPVPLTISHVRIETAEVPT